MVDTANAREVAVDYITDPVLGPVITLGAGGLAGSLIRDKVILIPPVTQAQARESIRPPMKKALRRPSCGSRALRKRFRRLPNSSSPPRPWTTRASRCLMPRGPYAAGLLRLNLMPGTCSLPRILRTLKRP